MGQRCLPSQHQYIIFKCYQYSRFFEARVVRCLLDAAPFLVEKDGAHVLQLGPLELSGELHGAPGQDLHHEPAVAVIVVLSMAAEQIVLYSKRFCKKDPKAGFSKGRTVLQLLHARICSSTLCF